MIRNCSRLALGQRRSSSSLQQLIPSTTRNIATSSQRPRIAAKLARDNVHRLALSDATIVFSFTPAQRRNLHATAFILAEETVKVPQMAESISEGTLKSWVKKEGDYVEADEEVATIETDKVDVSVNAPKAGTIKKTLANEEDTVAVGQELFVIDTDGKASDSSSSGGGGGEESAKAEPKEEKEEKKSEEEAKPKEEKKEEKQPARKEREEVKVEHKEEEPKREAPKKTEEPKQPKAQPGAGEKQAQSKEKDKGKVTGEGDRTERRVKMNRMRARIAERLKQSQNAAAFLTTFNEIDMSSAMSMRSAYKDKVLKEHGVKLGFMSIFARACAIALKELPAVNASIEGPGAGEMIVYHDYVDLSVAVATEKGLVTPVVRNVEGMNMVEIEGAIADLGKKARDNKLTIEDMAGGTFTISNGGVFGSLYGTPIINLPQSAVLGMHAINQKPVAVKGEVVIRPVMVVALTYDHRIIDGREAVTFLVRVKELVEDPRAMLLA